MQIPNTMNNTRISLKNTYLTEVFLIIQNKMYYFSSDYAFFNNNWLFFSSWQRARLQNTKQKISSYKYTTIVGNGMMWETMHFKHSSRPIGFSWCLFLKASHGMQKKYIYTVIPTILRSEINRFPLVKKSHKYSDLKRLICGLQLPRESNRSTIFWKWLRKSKRINNAIRIMLL